MSFNILPLNLVRTNIIHKKNLVKAKIINNILIYILYKL